MIPLERQRQILGALQQRGTASVAELQGLLGVSHMTVRRDIGALEDLGRVVSVSGGVSLPTRLVLDDPHAVKEGIRPTEKAAVAARAAELVSPGDLVLLDAGTTTLALAQILAPRADLAFLTNDLAIATFLAEHARSHDLYLAGGRVDGANLSTEGPQVADAISEFNIDIAFLSTSSFELRGMSVPTEAKKVVKQATLAHAARSVLLTDSSKYGKVAALRAIQLTELDAIITDSGLDHSARDGISQLDVELVLVDINTHHQRTRKVHP